MAVYFYVYESRRYGWLAISSTKEETEEYAKDEDNMDIYPCVTASIDSWPPTDNAPIVVNDVIDLLSYEINKVNIEIIECGGNLVLNIKSD